MTKTPLAEKLSMTHLADVSDEELKDQIVEATPDAANSTEKDVDDDPRTKERYPFSFSYRDDRGNEWKGSFVSQILSIQDRGRVGVLESTFNAGQPYESSPPLMRDIHAAIAHMTFSLAERPSWAKNLRNLKDPAVVFALFQEVAAHEMKFLGREATEAKSQGTGA